MRRYKGFILISVFAMLMAISILIWAYYSSLIYPSQEYIRSIYSIKAYYLTFTGLKYVAAENNYGGKISILDSGEDTIEVSVDYDFTGTSNYLDLMVNIGVMTNGHTQKIACQLGYDGFNEQYFNERIYDEFIDAGSYVLQAAPILQWKLKSE